MRVKRENTIDVSHIAEVQPYVTYHSSVGVKWWIGGDKRGVQWSVDIARDDFRALAKAMIGADREAALDAFASAISNRRRKVKRD